MKKNYFLLCFVFGFIFNNAFGQIVITDDFVSVPNGSATMVVIPNVLANDTADGLPVVLSDGYFFQASSSSNYIDLDTTTGAVVFSNGPAPVGSHEISYTLGNSNDLEMGMVIVNIGCAALNTPIVSNVIRPTCSNRFGSLSLSGLPATGQWKLYDNGGFIQFGTGTTATVLNLSAGMHEFYVTNNLGCRSPSSPIIDLRYLNGALVGTYVDTNTDGIPSVGDTILYQCTVTNESDCTLTNVTSFNGNIVLGGPIPSLASGATDNTTFTASYSITQNDINTGIISRNSTLKGTGGTISIYTNSSVRTVNYLNQTNGIKLVAFIDTNSNGIQDVGEADFRFGDFTYEINNDGTIHNIAANHACYLYETNVANSYDLGFSVYNSYSGYYGLATPTISNVTVANGSGITTYYFPLTIIPYIDLKVNIYSYTTPPRPGFTYTNTIQIQNTGNELIPAGTLTFTKNNVVSITAVSPTGTVANATGFTYDFTNLSAGESRYLTVTMQTPTIPTVALGDLLTNSASVTIPSGDVNTENNSASLTQAIVGSFDPNDKAESNGGRVLYAGFSANDYLTYTIRFENTGNFNAEFVRVNDVLDEKLDETTVRMVDASHSYVLDRVGSNLSWFFDDIQLPPSVANTNIGHGYVVFQVKPKPGFALGDVIPNTADIFFDFNPAIVTNTCTTEFVNNLANPSFTFDQLVSYPNPVKNVFHISNDVVMDSMTVTTVLGQPVLSKNIGAAEANVDLSELSKGVYFVKIKAGSQEKTIKVIKE